jgi:hypothetical protein
MPTTDTNPAMVDLVETVTRRFGPDRARSSSRAASARRATS